MYFDCSFCAGIKEMFQEIHYLYCVHIPLSTHLDKLWVNLGKLYGKFEEVCNHAMGLMLIHISTLSDIYFNRHYKKCF